MTTNPPQTISGKERDFWFDNIKGILMITVVMGHLISQLRHSSDVISYLYIFFNTFHMGTFMILSGHLAKRRIDHVDYITIINKTLIPYMTAQLLLYCTTVIIPDGLKAANSTYLSQLFFSFTLPVYQLWFLMALTIYTFFCAKTQPKKHPYLFMVGAIIASLACGYFQQVHVFKLTKSISFFPLFLLGYLIPKEFFSYIREKKYLVPLSLVIWCVFAYCMTLDSWSSSLYYVVGLATKYSNCDSLFLGLPAVCGRLIFLLALPIISFAFFVLSPRTKCIFTKLGQNSLYIFVLHSMIVVPLRCLHYEYKIMSHIDTWYLKLLYLFFCTLVAFVLSRDFIKKIFKPILEPKVDISSLPHWLDKYYTHKNQEDGNN